MNGRSCCRKTNFFYHHIPAYFSTLYSLRFLINLSSLRFTLRSVPISSHFCFLSLSLQLTYILTLSLSLSLSLPFSSSSLSLALALALSASSQSHLISHSSFFSLVPYIFLSPTLSSYLLQIRRNYGLR